VILSTLKTRGICYEMLLFVIRLFVPDATSSLSDTYRNLKKDI